MWLLTHVSDLHAGLSSTASPPLSSIFILWIDAEICSLVALGLFLLNANKIVLKSLFESILKFFINEMKDL